MIVFDLICTSGHSFEGWFDSSEAFEEQYEKGLLACPYCESSEIKKILSPVSVKRSTTISNTKQDATPDPPIDYKHLVCEMTKFMQENFENVGPDFSSEVLKMHYGVKEKRNIRGIATEKEEKTLHEEGIEFFKVPVLKDIKNKNS